MKKNIRYYYSLLIVIFLISVLLIHCDDKDPKHIKVEGRVYDNILNQSVPNANVSLLCQKIESGVYNLNYTTIGSAKTDENGNFKFEFDVERVAAYRFEITKNGYFENITDYNPDEVEANDVFSKTFIAKPATFVNLHIKNTNPHDNTDFIAFYFSKGGLECNNCCPDTISHAYGVSVDLTRMCKTYGHQDIHIVWHINKNGNHILDSAVLYCPVFDTVNYEILY